MIKGKANGKLYWAGEYAIVEPNNTAVISPVDRFLTATITPSELNFGIVHSGLDCEPFKWCYQGQQVLLQGKTICPYILNTLDIFNAYIRHLNQEPQIFNLDISSELKDENEKKYGLGSSAAIVVAIVKALNNLYGTNLSNLQIFKISALVNIQIGSNGSLGDVAAASFGQLIAYTSFDRDIIKVRMQTENVYELVNSDWEHLKIEILPADLEMTPLVAWTKKAASSSELIAKVAKVRNTYGYQKFLIDSKICVGNVIRAIKNKDSLLFKQNIAINHRLLANLGKLANAEIETVALKLIVDIAFKFGECGKISGAGGGDCALTFVFDPTNIDKIRNEWQKHDISEL